MYIGNKYGGSAMALIGETKGLGSGLLPIWEERNPCPISLPTGGPGPSLLGTDFDVSRTVQGY